MTYIVGIPAAYFFGTILLQFLFGRIAHRWTLAFVLSHTLVLLYVAAHVARGVFAENAMYAAQVELSWLPVIVMDFPVSMFRTGTNKIIIAVYENSFEVRTLWCPLVHYGIFGTIQSLVIGRMVDAYFRLMH